MQRRKKVLGQAFFKAQTEWIHRHQGTLGGSEEQAKSGYGTVIRNSVKQKRSAAGKRQKGKVGKPYLSYKRMSKRTEDIGKIAKALNAVQIVTLLEFLTKYWQRRTTSKHSL